MLNDSTRCTRKSSITEPIDTAERVLMAEPPNHQRPRENGAENSARPLAGLRCLVLDDEFLIALDIQQILEAAGAAAVVCVSSAEAALAALQSEPPFALAVLDILLNPHGESSAAVAQALTKAGTPFVLLTGASDADSRSRQFSAAPVVEKPYQVPLLLEALRRALASR
jgi:CheY-like chemotaxis protein